MNIRIRINGVVVAEMPEAQFEQYQAAICAAFHAAGQVAPILHVIKVPEPLNGWTFDQGDVFAIELMLNQRAIVPAIKFARMKSDAGLKEAKEWILDQFSNTCVANGLVR